MRGRRHGIYFRRCLAVLLAAVLSIHLTGGSLVALAGDAQLEMATELEGVSQMILSGGPADTVLEGTEANGMYSLAVEAGQSVKIQNSGSSSVNVTVSESGALEYEQVESSGKVSSFGLLQSKTVYVDAGGVTTITSVAENELFISIASEQKETVVFTLSQTPALKHVTMENGKHYRLVNDTGYLVMFHDDVEGTQKWVEYVLRRQSGSYFTFGSDSALRSLDPGTSSSNLTCEDVTVCASEDDFCADITYPYTYFEAGATIEESATPALMHFTFENGKSYELVNNTGTGVSVQSNVSGRGDWLEMVQYRSTGSIYTFNTDSSIGTLAADGTGRVNRVRVTVSVPGEENFRADMTMPYQEYAAGVTVRECEMPALMHMTLYNNRSYYIDNRSGEYVWFMHDASTSSNWLEYVTFDQTGKVLTYGQARGLSELYASSGKAQSQVITVCSQDNDQLEVDVTFPYEWYDQGLTFSESAFPALQSYVLAPGEKCRMVSKLGYHLSVQLLSDQSQPYSVLQYSAPDRYTLLENQTKNVQSLYAQQRLYVQNLSDNTSDLRVIVPYGIVQDGLLQVQRISYDIAEVPSETIEIQCQTDLVQSALSGEQPERTPVNIEEYEVTLENLTQGIKIEEFSIDQNTIMLSQVAGNAGDRLLMTVSGNSICDTKLEFVLQEQPENVLSVELQQRGYIRLSLTEHCLFAPHVQIFGQDGKRIAKADNVQSTNWIETEEVPEGTYQVLLLLSDGNFWEFEDLGEFERLKLTNGEDYFLQTVRVTDGQIVPVDATGFQGSTSDYFRALDMSAVSVEANREEVTVDSLMQITCAVKKNTLFAEQVEQGRVRISLPSGVELVENSVRVNGEESTYTSGSYGQVITVGADAAESEVSFIVKPNSYSDAFRVTADYLFHYQGSEYSEHMDAVTFKTPKLTLEIPEQFSGDEVRAQGLTSPKTKVYIYIDGKEAATATAKQDGTYSVDVPVPEGDQTTYDVYACILPGTGGQYRTDSVQITRNPLVPEIHEIELQYHKLTNRIYKTTISADRTRPAISLNPAGGYSFVLDIENDASIRHVYVASSKNGSTQAVPAYKDEESGKWVTSGYFDEGNHSYTPGSIQVLYDVEEQYTVNEVSDHTFQQTFETLHEENRGKADVTVTENTADTWKGEIYFPRDYNETTMSDGEVTVDMEMTMETVGDMPESTLQDMGFERFSPSSDDYYTSVQTSDNYVEFQVYDGQNIFSTTFNAIGDGLEGSGNLIEALGHLLDDGMIKSLGKELGLYGEIYDFIGDVINYSENLARIENSTTMSAEQKAYARNQLLCIEIVKKGIAVLAATATYGSGLVVPVAGPLFVGFASMIISGMCSDFLDDYGRYLADGGTMDLWQYFWNVFRPKWLLDPSGYVYEVQEENRLEDVTATIYYRDGDGNVVKWDAEDYYQDNPLLTDAEGSYAWDVPEGEWQVQYEKEGYETTSSEWLPVPPIQTDVNVAMKSVRPAYLERLIFEDNAVCVTFSNYVRTSDISAGSVMVKCEDQKCDGTFEALDAVMVDGIETARTFLFRPKQARLTSGALYTVTASAGIRTYAGVLSEEKSVLSQICQIVPSSMKLDDAGDLSVNKGDTAVICGTLGGASADLESAKLMAEVDNSYLAEVTDVKIQSDGSFEVTVRAKTQGTTKIRLYVEDTDLESTVVLEIRKAKAEEKPLTGDVNGDGITNASDALLILQHAAKLAQLTGKQEAAADLNADGVISAADALIVLQIAAQLI